MYGTNLEIFYNSTLNRTVRLIETLEYTQTLLAALWSRLLGNHRISPRRDRLDSWKIYKKRYHFSKFSDITYAFFQDISYKDNFGAWKFRLRYAHLSNKNLLSSLFSNEKVHALAMDKVYKNFSMKYWCQTCTYKDSLLTSVKTSTLTWLNFHQNIMQCF